MMASKNIIQDIDENFLQCPVCMEQFKIPKILPCLHRYCQHCLAGTITDRDTDIECPTCREIYPLPPNGIDGFKTDFNTKNIIEFIQSKQSQKDKGGSPKDAPMCHNHPGKPIELFCTTCGNQPICVSCIVGMHKGHNLQEASSLASIERAKLTKSLAVLMRYKEKIYSRPEEVKAIKRRLRQAVCEKKAEIQREFHLNKNKIKREIREKDDKLEKRRKELGEAMKREMLPRKQQLEKEMKEAKDKYDKFCEDEKEAMDREFEKIQQENEKDKDNLRQQFEKMNKGIGDLLTSLQAQEERNLKRITELSTHFDDILKQFENVTATASSILAERHDWTDVQCIPDICGVIDHLIEDAKKDCPELKTLSDVMVGGLSSAIGGGGVIITKREESLVNIEGATGDKWDITGITGCLKGIILTGRASVNYSHITLINTSGRKVKQKIIRTMSWGASCYCDSLSPFKIVTASWVSKIGIYNVRYNSYKKAGQQSEISRWYAGSPVSCVAVDRVNKQIIVGGMYIGDVYVFNSDLEYIHTMTLPEVIKYPYDMTIHRGNLLICDYSGDKAYAVTMKKGSPCEVIHEFTKPDIGEGDCTPYCVCSDKHGFIHLLWTRKISGEQRNILVQYSQDGQQMLQTRLVDCKDWARCITTVETEQGEKILIATGNSGKLITYGLN